MSAEEAEKRRSSALTKDILAVVGEHPGGYAKGSLATAVKGASREKKLAEIDRLISTGVLGHEKEIYGPHKLVLMPSAQEVQF